MKITDIKRIGIGVLSVLMLGGAAWAVETAQSAGNLAMPLMFEGGTARAMSMGSAVVGVPQGSASLFWNPAGLGVMGNCMELGLHHNSGLGDTMQETAVIGIPMGAMGGFAASLNYVNNGTYEGRNSVGVKTADYTAGDMSASVGWGKELFSHISAGMAVKYNKQTVGSASYSAYAADLGLLWAPRTRLNIGVTYSNIGTKVAENGLDSGWRVGASYGVNKDLLLALSAELKPGGIDRLQVGIEDWFHPQVALRTGYLHNFTHAMLDGVSGLTVGIGIKVVKNLMFDYAYIPYGDLGISQRLSITYKFACREKPVKAKPRPATAVKPEPATIAEHIVILEQLIVLEDTHFEYDSATLTISGAKILIENTQILKDNPEVKIRVAGYASASGTAEYNQKLSERRAEAVRAILINVGGIAPERLTTIGYGETRPAMYEPIPSHINSREARANMRVLFEIIVK